MTHSFRMLLRKRESRSHPIGKRRSRSHPFEFLLRKRSSSSKVKKHGKKHRKQGKKQGNEEPPKPSEKLKKAPQALAVAEIEEGASAVEESSVGSDDQVNKSKPNEDKISIATEREYENVDSVGTSIIALRHNGGVFTAADSRGIFHTFGNVFSDDDVKFARYWGNIYVASAGTTTVIAKAVNLAVDRCNISQPTSIREVADILAKAHNDLAERRECNHIVFGRAFGEAQSKILKVYALVYTEEGQLRKCTSSDTHDPSIMYTYRVEEVECAAFVGTGEELMEMDFKGKAYNADVADWDTAMDIIRSAMNSARISNYHTDGPIKLVSVTDSAVNAAATFHQSNPLDAEDPASGYGAWMVGNFRPWGFKAV